MTTELRHEDCLAITRLGDIDRARSRARRVGPMKIAGSHSRPRSIARASLTHKFTSRDPGSLDANRVRRLFRRRLAGEVATAIRSLQNSSGQRVAVSSAFLPPQASRQVFFNMRRFRSKCARRGAAELPSWPTLRQNLPYSAAGPSPLAEGKELEYEDGQVHEGILAGYGGRTLT